LADNRQDYIKSISRMTKEILSFTALNQK